MPVSIISRMKLATDLLIWQHGIDFTRGPRFAFGNIRPRCGVVPVVVIVRHIIQQIYFRDTISVGGLYTDINAVKAVEDTRTTILAYNPDRELVHIVPGNIVFSAGNTVLHDIVGISSSPIVIRILQQRTNVPGPECDIGHGVTIRGMGLEDFLDHIQIVHDPVLDGNVSARGFLLARGLLLVAAVSRVDSTVVIGDDAGCVDQILNAVRVGNG